MRIQAVLWKFILFTSVQSRRWEWKFLIEDEKQITLCGDGWHSLLSLIKILNIQNFIVPDKFDLVNIFETKNF